MHFAGFIAYVGESVADPGKYYRNNVAGSLSLMEACGRHGIGMLVFSSTCRRSTAMPEPADPGGCAEAADQSLWRIQVDGREHAARFRRRARPAIDEPLRYFNAAGADPDGETGERHEPETHLIPLALDAAAGNGKTLTVFGDGLFDTPTAPASATISTSATWPRRTCGIGALLGGAESTCLQSRHRQRLSPFARSSAPSSR